MIKLSKKNCEPCEGGVPPFTPAQSQKYLRQLKSGWKIFEGRLRKEFKFRNFVESMGFANQVALIAQAQDHHPVMHIAFNKVGIELWTHAADGLTENDFVLAAKIDLL